MIANLRFTLYKANLAYTTDELALRSELFASHLQAAERSIPSALGMVEIAMLIAAKHVVEEERPLNFVITYERYSAHSKRVAASGLSQSRPFSRGVCLKVSIFIPQHAKTLIECVL